MNRIVKVGAAAVAVAMAGVLAVPGVAEASARGGCSYPRVCVYVGGQMSHPSGRFQQVTDWWQYLGRSFGGDGVYNTRHDDVAYIKTTTGRIFCIRPGKRVGLYNGGATAIRISSSSSC